MSSSAEDIATLAAIVVTAISFHFLLALPDGRLPATPSRRVMAVRGYVIAVAVGLCLRPRPAALLSGPTAR